MVQAVQFFQTSDGNVFESQSEAVQHESILKNKVAIETFLDVHFPIPAPVPAVNEDGTPKLGEDGKPEMVRKQNNGRGYARRAIALWLAQNDSPAPEAEAA